MFSSVRSRKILIALIFVLVGICFYIDSIKAQSKAEWEKDLAAWRAEHAADLQKPDGWLALAGLAWLDAGDNAMGSAADNKVKLPASAPAHVGVLYLEGGT